LALHELQLPSGTPVTSTGQTHDIDCFTPELIAISTTATFDGATVPLTAAPGAIEIAVTGPGTLSLDNGAATLTVTGGTADRRIILRLYLP
jgi:hypothetical protein